uniref:Large ribosomal subunit protein P2 n=1 Tax=Oryzias latipes TaxID=8090 RepID=A0A3P9J6Q4_ORYLA
MRYVAAYLLAALGGNTSPSAKDIKDILGSVGIEADDERLNKVIGELNGKNINEVVNSGLSKLASVPAGGAVAAPSAAPSGATGAAPAPGVYIVLNLGTSLLRKMLFFPLIITCLFLQLVYCCSYVQLFLIVLYIELLGISKVNGKLMFFLFFS